MLVKVWLLNSLTHSCPLRQVVRRAAWLLNSGAKFSEENMREQKQELKNTFIWVSNLQRLADLK